MPYKRCTVSGAVVMNGNGSKTFLTKHTKLGVWLYPGGHTEDGENPEQAALREVLEETGFRIRLVDTEAESRKLIRTKATLERPKPIAIMVEKVPYKTGPHIHYDTVYLGVVSTQKRENVKGHESTDMGWFSRSEINALDTFENIRAIIMRAFELQNGAKSPRRKI